MQQIKAPRENSEPANAKSGSKYINLMTDYGLKSVLKEEDLAKHFLNVVLNGTLNIQKITYLDKEITGKHKSQRTAIFDLLCEDEHNREFIIEIQRVKQDFFKDRSIFYTSARIQDNAPKGKKAREEWNFQQKPIFFIGILDFELPETRPDKFKYIVQLSDIEEKSTFYKKLTYIYLELPKFAKSGLSESLGELTDLGKWLYVFKNLHEIETLPAFLNEEQFHKILEIAEVANMTREQRQEYERSLKQMRDEHAIKSTAFREGEEIGIKKGEEIGIKKGEEIGIKKGEDIGREKQKIETIKKLLESGIPIGQIAEIFSVDESYVLEIRENMTEEEQ